VSVYKLHGVASADTDGLAQLDVQFDGRIVAWMIMATALSADAIADGFEIEISFLSGSMFTNNDARGVIAMAAWQQQFLTTGGGPSSVNSHLSGLQIPVSAGERVYLHLNAAGSPGNVAISCLLYVEDDSDPLLRRRR